MPFCLKEVGFLPEQETAIDLLAGVAERLTRRQARHVEAPPQEGLEGIASLMGPQRLDPHEFVAQLGEQTPIERRSRRRPACVCLLSVQTGQKP
ncbi:hypothetical protein GCM10007864_18790 [Sinorhizobium fredii]|nr:hypothetical protein GCM10007864_18790 [Sinorhizobium fredii]